MNRTVIHPLPSHELVCPRCGYDLRGTVSAWADRCPLAGTCTECGLVYEWRHVLMIAKFEPRWCVEFVPNWLGVPRACLRTLARSFRPVYFWQQLHMSSLLRPRRLLAYGGMLVLIALLPYVVLQSTRAVLVRRELSAVLTLMAEQQQPAVAMYRNMIALVESGQITERPMDMSREEQLEFLRGELAKAQAKLKPPQIDMSYAGAILEAVLFPFGSTSWGTMTLPNGMVDSYPPPIQFDMYLGASAAGGFTFQLRVTRAARTFDAVMINLLLSLGLALALPASFVLLPASRRRAKVQWRHIFRIAAYSMGMPAIVVGAIVASVGMTLIPQTDGMVPAIMWKLPALLWIILPVWWWSAIRNYLRMPHAGAIAVLMTVMIALMCAPVWIASMPRWLEQMLV